MGTGQCTETRRFLQDNPDIFWEYSCCINAFETAKSANDQVYHSDPAVQRAIKAGKKHKKFITGMIWYEFSQVWGQPCCHLSTKDGIEERFQPIFEVEVQDKWEEWLGTLFNKDPASVTQAQKRPWREALHFVQSLGIKGFTSGLTPLQFANNLWVAGIVAEPSAIDMVSWLQINRDLGASRGLQHPGFQLNTPKDFLAAFLVVHGHLDEYLSIEDKDILHFGVIFVEHLLCKISRWGVCLGSLEKLNTVIRGGVWSMDANVKDHCAFPVPVDVLHRRLKTAIEEANVCALL